MQSHAKKNHKQQLNDLSLTLENVSYIQGWDTYVQPGKVVGTIALAKSVRDSFFEKKPLIKALLSREQTNPLVEEGQADQRARAREGEYYLAYESITMIVDSLVRKKTSKAGIKYDGKNIFIIKNDVSKLEDIFRNIDLKNNEDAKFIYISGIHAIPFYLRRIDNKIHAFIVDSEAGVYSWPTKIIKQIHECFPNAEVTLSSTLLQKDYFSCSTFAINALLFFASNGSKVFPYLDKNETKYNDILNAKILSADKLMPELMKLSQSEFQLNEEMLNTIVSKKKKLTLQGYLNKYKFTDAGTQKKFNSAALFKKYSYLNKLSDKLLAPRYQNLKIDSNILHALPDQLQHQHDRFSRLPKNKVRVNKNCLDLYFKILDFVENPGSSKLDENEDIIRNKIMKNDAYFLTRFRAKYNKTEKNNKDKISLDKLFYVASYIETKHANSIEEYLGFSKKLLLLFQSYDSCIKYLKRFAQKNNPKAIHDICLFEMPKKENWNKNYWGELVLKYGNNAAKFLSLASEIDMLMAATESEKTCYKNEIEKIQTFAAKVQYKRANENPQLAKLCVTYKRNEKQFEEALNIVTSQLKTYDLLPNIEIHGQEIDAKYKNFRFVKLPINNLLGLFLGDETGCCQSIDRIGAACAIHGMKSIMSGFYVIYEDDKLVAQTWAWLGRKGELVFDSFESANLNQVYLCKPFFMAAAKEITRYGFSRVLIGQGGHTPDLGVEKDNDPAIQLDKCDYSDAASQFVLWESPFQDVVAKFKSYAFKVGLESNKFMDVIKKIEEKKSIENDLIYLISNNIISFDDFFSFIKFLYAIGNYFLHLASDNFVVFVLWNFERKLYPAFSLCNHEEDWFVSLMKRDVISITKKLIPCMPGNDLNLKISRLRKGAAYFDAINNFVYLYKKLESAAFINNLVDDNYGMGGSVLRFILAMNSMKCLTHIVSRLNDVGHVFKLLEFKTKEDDGVLHCVIRNNDLKLAEKLLSAFKNRSSKLEKILLSEGLWEVKIESDEYKGFRREYWSPISCAIYNNYLDLVKYLSGLYEESILINILSRNKIPFGRYKEISCIDYIFKENRLDVLKHLSCVISQGNWTALFNRNLSYVNNNSIECVLFIINNVKDKNSFKNLLNYNLMNIVNENLSDESIHRTVSALLMVYQDNVELFVEVVINFEYLIFKQLFLRNNLKMLNEIFHAISLNKSVFEEFIKIHGKNIFEIMLSKVHAKISIDDGIDKEIEKIDLFWKCFGNENIKIILNQSHHWIINVKSLLLLKHIVPKIKKIDNGEFLKIWLLNEINKDYILSSSLANQNNSIAQFLFDIYVEYLGNSKTTEIVRSFNLLRHKNYVKKLPILKYAYNNLCQSDEEKINLYHVLLKIDCPSYETDSIDWICYQDGISNQMLIDSLTFNVKEQTAYGGGIEKRLNCTNSLYVQSIWKACVSRMPSEELIPIIKKQLPILIENIIEVTKAYVRTNVHICDNLNAAKIIMHEWLQYLRKYENHNVFDCTKYFPLLTNCVFSYKNEEGKENDFLDIVFLNCDRQVRFDLLSSHKQILTTSAPTSLNSLLYLVQHYNKLDVLLNLKESICNIKSTTFFTKSSHLFSELEEKLKLIDQAQLVFTKGCPTFYLSFIQKSVVKTIWDGLLDILTKSQALNEKDKFIQDYLSKFNLINKENADLEMKMKNGDEKTDVVDIKKNQPS